MVILKVSKVKEGLIRVTTDEKEIVFQADGEVRAFGESYVLMEGGDAYGLINVEDQTEEGLEFYESPVIETDEYFEEGGLVVESEEDRDYANSVIDFMRKEFNNSDDIEDINDLKSHLFKLCLSRNIDSDTLMQILSLQDYDDERIWNKNFYIAFRLAEQLC